MTQYQYLCNQVEKLINECIIPMLDTNNEDVVNTINKIGFLYSCDRLHPIQVIIALSNVLNVEQLNKIMQYYKKLDSRYLALNLYEKEVK